MKSGIISKQIRLNSLKKLIIPVVLITTFLVIVFNYNLHLRLLPLSADSVSEITTDKFAKQKYIAISVDRLTYTGYDCIKNGKNVGSYYYYLTDDSCTFFLLKPGSEHRFDIFVEGRLIPLDNFDKLVPLLAKDIDWNPTDLGAITTPYIVSEVDYVPATTGIIYIIVIALVSIALAHSLFLIIKIIFPFIGVNYKTFLAPKQLRSILKNAEYEITKESCFSMNNIYITDSYFISLNNYHIFVLPLDEIVWAYKHSILISAKLLGYQELTYNLRIITNQKKTYVCPNNHKYVADSILEHLAERMPEILIGYSPDENKR